MNATGGGLLWFYRATTTITAPLIARHLRTRLHRQREDPQRFAERFGHAAAPRPPGPLLWLHAASVGEVTAALPLIERLRTDNPSLHLLLTSGTVTSARVAAQRLPAGVLHQFAPVDTPHAVRRFYAHWRPIAGVFLESEIWPNLVYEARRAAIPLILVNACMSPKSFNAWRRVLPLARAMFGAFAAVLAQSSADRDRFIKLGAANATCTASLKYAAAPLPADPVKLAQLKDAVATRTIWLAASTHEGEERVVIDAHRHLAKTHADLLTIIAPRHPDRGLAVADMITSHGLAAARQAIDEALTADTDVYVADTIGEMGTWYRLCPVAFIGGSLIPHGGHNPLEAAKLSCAVVTGPHTANFVDIIAELRGAGALSVVDDAASLAATVRHLLADNHARRRQIAAAEVLADGKADVVRVILDALAPILQATPEAPHA